MKEGYYWARPYKLSKTQVVGYFGGEWYIIGIMNTLSEMYEVGDYIGPGED